MAVDETLIGYAVIGFANVDGAEVGHPIEFTGNPVVGDQVWVNVGGTFVLHEVYQRVSGIFEQHSVLPKDGGSF